MATSTGSLPASGGVTRQSDLALWYKFDETSGTTAAPLIGSGDMTLTNGASFASGINGNAIDYDGSNDYAESASGPTVAGDCTLSWWVYPDSNASRRNMVGSTNYWTTGKANTFTATHTTGGDVYLLHTGASPPASNYYLKTWDTNMSTGAWHHVALVLDTSANTVNCWVDGTDHGSQATSGYTFADISEGIICGMYYQGGAGPYGAFNGKIDDLRVYKEALADGDIGDIYNSGDGDWG